MGANQFGYTSKQVMESRYKMPFKDAMQMLADRGLTRNDVAPCSWLLSFNSDEVCVAVGC